MHNISTATINSSAAMGSPCLAPLCSLKYADRFPAWSTPAWKSVISVLIYDINLSPKPKCLRESLMNLWLMQSNALLKSTANISPNLFFCLASSITSHVVTLFSLMYLSLRNPVWSGDIISCSACCSLLAMTELRSL